MLNIQLNAGQSSTVYILSYFIVPSLFFSFTCAVIYFLKRKYITATWLLYIFFFGWPFLRITFQWNNVSQTKVETFSVMTYNIASFHPNRYSSKLGDQQNSQFIFDWFRTVETPEIFCVQEFFHGYENDAELTLDSLRNIGNYGYYYLNPYFRDVYNGFFGVVTFSKFKAIKSGELIYGKSVMNKGVYHDFKIGSDTVRIVNVHLSSMSIRIEQKNDNSTVKQYYNSAKLAVEKLKKGYDDHFEETRVILEFVLNSPYPVILCGDFNSLPYAYPYQIFSKYFNDAFVSKGKGMGITYHYHPFYARIDQIFYDKKLKIHEFKVHKENPWSDHYPISARFEIN